MRSISFEEFKKSLIKVAILSRGLESVFEGLSEIEGSLELRKAFKERLLQRLV